MVCTMSSAYCKSTMRCIQCENDAQNNKMFEHNPMMLGYYVHLVAW